MSKLIEQSFQAARETYATVSVDVEQALARLRTIPVSLNCWQGDDVLGFEANAGLSLGGVQPTGNYPGRARNGDELRADLEQALALIPGTHRVNLHAIYAETGGKRVDRDALAPEHFARWIDWAKARKLGLDYNGTFFAHPLAGDGFTLTSRDTGKRKFWVRHAISSRVIGAAFGKALGKTCVTNVWVPDGYKDTPADRKTPRELLAASLDEAFAVTVDARHNLDALEGKLFGIGAESYTVGSHEFYLAYAAKHGKLITLDAGHYHPTETIADKFSAVLGVVPGIQLHVSRGVRWDSDHVVTLTDDLRAIAEEMVRGQYLDRMHIGLDFFDASINRVACWTIGTRAMLKALLIALLEPTATIQKFEAAGDYTSRLAYMEEFKNLPFGAVWDYYCLQSGTPVGAAWMDEVKKYEQDVQFKRK